MLDAKIVQLARERTYGFIDQATVRADRWHCFPIAHNCCQFREIQITAWVGHHLMGCPNLRGLLYYLLIGLVPD